MSTVGRYELKYPMRFDQLEVARAFASSFCEPDRAGELGRYEVHSLYFDTRDDLLARRTIEGHRERFKVRVRTYGHDTSGPLYPEIKRRVGRVIHKDRATASREDMAALIAGRPTDLDGSPEALTFRLLIDRVGLEPRVWVRYVREAWASPFGDGARLTFDWALQAQIPPDSDPLSPDPHGWFIVPMETPRLLELKFNGAFPAWMDRLVRSAGLSRQSFSKYTRAAQAIGPVLERGFGWML